MPPKPQAQRSQNDPFPAELQDLEGVSRVQFVDLNRVFKLFVLEWVFFVLFFNGYWVEKL